MNAFSRRGACPALSAPMRTGDGLLVRLNPVAGGLPPASLIGLAEAARRRGNGIIEVTARGSLQIRGLTEDSAPLLAAEVDALGIGIRGGIPVEMGPLAGLDPEEIADPRPLVERIRTALDKAGLAARLGPKVSVVIDGGGRLGMDAVMADVRLVAVRNKTGIVWQMSVAGDTQNAVPLAIASETTACDAAVAVLRMIAEMGIEARARDLRVEQRAQVTCQFESLHSVAPPSVLPVPASEKIALLSPLSPPSKAAEKEPAAKLPISPQAGEMSGRTEGGAKERLPLSSPQADRAPIGVFDLRALGVALGIGLPFGSMAAGKIIALTQSALALGATGIRLAPGRALLFLGIDAKSCGQFGKRAASLGFVTDAADPRTRVAACPGAPACASGRIATRKIAEQIAAAGVDLLDGSVDLHVSGCAKGCAHPAPAALTLVGGDNGAGLVVDGTAKTLPVGYRPGYDASHGLSRVAAAVRVTRNPGESSAACLARIDLEKIAQAFGIERQ